MGTRCALLNYHFGQLRFRDIWALAYIFGKLVKLVNYRLTICYAGRMRLSTSIRLLLVAEINSVPIFKSDVYTTDPFHNSRNWQSRKDAVPTRAEKLR